MSYLFSILGVVLFIIIYTAESIFKDLLKSPDSNDYTQSELNYIQGLRKLQNTQETAE